MDKCLSLISKNFNLNLDKALWVCKKGYEFFLLFEEYSSKTNIGKILGYDDFLKRHFFEGGAIASFLYEKAPKKKLYIAEFGSGGGLLGINMAVFFNAYGLDYKFYLVEKNPKKYAFVDMVVKKINLSDSVFSVLGDLNSTDFGFGFDVIVGRAFTPMKSFFSISNRFLNRNGSCIYMLSKGQIKKLEINATIFKRDFHLFDDRNYTLYWVVKYGDCNIFS